jgi:hypothetical protein
MLGVIVQHSVEIVTFISWLSLALYQPQMRHLIQLVDALLVCDSRKTLTNLYRQLAASPDPKTAADFFRESPWQAIDISGPRKRWMLFKFLELACKLNLASAIQVGVDDSLGKKHKDTRHLEAVSFHHNHTDSTRKKQVYSNGYVYVEVHIQIGPIGFLFDTRLYLREKTVRQLNRRRSADSRLHFRSKYALAREMLVELAALLPKGYPVYVLFDSWYASAKLIKFCRRQRWHVICAVKTNRRLNRKRMDHHNQSLRNQRYQRVTLPALDPSRPPRAYYVRSVQGHLEEVADEVRGIISKRHPGDKRPKYFVCTDLTLSVQQALRYYQRRWPVEVDNWYLKEALGLGDFRLQSFEATQKWFAVVVLAMNYLQYQAAVAYLQEQSVCSLTDIIRQHRLDHWRKFLRKALTQLLRSGSIDATIESLLPAASWAVT